tara:strand:- start:1846 stop:2229 length:384 start_codon:yes stop_codon:yes gene_type:complete
MKTIAQQLQVKNFPFEINDKNGNQIYYENSKGYWCKREHDANGNEIYCESSDGLWWKRERDESGNLIRYEDSDGYWHKSQLDAQGNEIYFENSNGYIRDKRPKIVEVTLEDIASKLGISVEQLIIKD